MAHAILPDVHTVLVPGTVVYFDTHRGECVVEDDGEAIRTMFQLSLSLVFCISCVILARISIWR